MAAAATTLADQVTVVLLTFNCAHRLRPILDHLAELDLPVIAVDNGSADATRQVLQEYPQFELVALPQNIGAAGRNAGVQRARTPYIAFCDDDGWWERDGLARAVAAFDRYPRLALVNARIAVGDCETLDPISAEMANSPLPERDGIPGKVLLGFVAGAVVMRAVAYVDAGGYDPRFFIGAEEDTLSFKLARAGWQLRYREDIVAHHWPSVANAPKLRAYGLRNALWTCWLHRRFGSACRYTLALLADAPKTSDWLRAMLMTVRGLPWVWRARDPLPAHLDEQLRTLDRRRFADRRPFWNRADPFGSRTTAIRQEQSRTTA